MINASASSPIVCNHNCEDVIHILFECSVFVHVWHNGSLLKDVKPHYNNNMTPSQQFFSCCSDSLNQNSYALQPFFGLYGNIKARRCGNK